MYLQRLLLTFKKFTHNILINIGNVIFYIKYFNLCCEYNLIGFSDSYVFLRMPDFIFYK